MKYHVTLLASLMITASAIAYAQMPATPAKPAAPAAKPALNIPKPVSVMPVVPMPVVQAPDETLDEEVEAASETNPTQSKINEALSRLPMEKAAIFDTVMRKNVEKNREKQQQLRSTYTNIRNNFVGENFDKELFLQMSKEARKLQSEIRTDLDSDLATIASQYTQEERQIIFNALPARYTRE